MRRGWIRLGALLMLAVTAICLSPGWQEASNVAERLTNGSFEEGFYATPLGLVGNGWQWFVSGEGPNYGFHADTWAPVVYDGENSQLIEISTIGRPAGSAPYYAGIYQRVAVVPGATYELSVHGMLRAIEGDPDCANYSYRVQYGIDYNGGDSWEAVGNWVEIPWDSAYPRLTPGALGSHAASVVATTQRLTVFVRVWYKWATVNRELDVNLDGISLRGAPPADVNKPGETYSVIKIGATSYTVLENTTWKNATKLSVDLSPPSLPVVGWEYTVPVTGSNGVGVTALELYDEETLLGRAGYEVGPLTLSHDWVWKPSSPGRHVLKAIAYDAVGAKAVQQVEVTVGRNRQFLANGSFESGFAISGQGQVGVGWGAFQTGGRAVYGYYDETWSPLVYDGKHSQLIEINTKGQPGTEADRFAGLYQTVRGLTRGATYRLSMAGMLRVLAEDEDRTGYGYRVQWGYTTDGSTEWQTVDNWVEIPWNEVHLRLDPGEMEPYSASFQAPSDRITLFIRVWKKWATPGRELDVNLDAIRLEGYGK